jgi:hypothetical protein
VPFSTNALYMDTTVKYVSKELYKQLTGLIPSGIQNNNETVFDVYPNPAHSSLYISLPKVDDYTYEIKSLEGKSIKSGAFSNSNEIGVSDIKTGIYILVVSGKINSFTKRIIIQ